MDADEEYTERREGIDDDQREIRRQERGVEEELVPIRAQLVRLRAVRDCAGGGTPARASRSR